MALINIAPNFLSFEYDSNDPMLNFRNLDEWDDVYDDQMVDSNKPPKKPSYCSHYDNKRKRKSPQRRTFS